MTQTASTSAVSTSSAAVEVVDHLGSATPAQGGGATALSDTRTRRQPGWMIRYRVALLGVDVCCLLLATAFGFVLRFGPNPMAISVNYALVGVALVAGWLVALQANGGYELKHLATGPEEAKRVLRASATLAGVTAVVCYATKTEIARGFVVGVVPLGIVLLATGRTAVRRYVYKRRAAGEWSHRILAVGTTSSVRHLLDTTVRATRAGLLVVGVCVDDAPIGTWLGSGVPVLGGVGAAAAGAHSVQADVVAVTGEGLGPAGVRELGWQLEGTARGLVMAPSLAEVAGTRVHVTPVEGLPLVWLDPPQLGRMPRVTKRALDLVGGLALLVLALPVLVCTAVAIKATSRGPVFFRQARLGVNGEVFNIRKFRSMCVGAESLRSMILEMNEQDGHGVLFKIRHDPRLTPIGKWIRKFSIDELPQLVHVVSGRMSLVGPRPLAAADSTYEGAARRRLLVRPGLTGLWQVSGRSETSWEDAVRMDLYYVENWSLGLDISILLRTIAAVFGRTGAY